MMPWFKILFFILIVTPCYAQSSLIDRIQKTQESMVEVSTELTKVLRPAPGKKARLASFNRTGAGMIIDPVGIIVTNTHTIINAPFIFVTLRDGEKFPAEVLFASEGYDFAFLRIKTTRPLKAVPWANSSQITLGETITAIGNSDFNNQSILSGHITGIVQNQEQMTNEFLELDLELFRGDSGGPILNNRGHLLGIIMAKSQTQNRVCLAIASNKIREQYWQYRQKLP